MRTVDVAFVFDEAARELDVACAIVARLRRQGLSAEITQYPIGIAKAIVGLRPRVVVIPYAYSHRGLEALLAYWGNATYFSMTWEQIFYPGVIRTKLPRGDFAMHHVIHHAWGQAYAAELRSAGIPDARIFVNGHPAYALYDPPYRNYFATRSQLAELFGLDVNRRWVFFPESYAWAFFPRSHLEQVVADGQPAEDVRSMVRFCNESLSQVIPWCAEVARKGDVELILRPRPDTRQSDFEDLVQRLLSVVPSHFHVLKERSIREWILASDVVVSSHSTSLIEAALAGKSVQIVEPIPIPSLLHSDWLALLPRLRSSEEFLRACAGGDAGPTGSRLGEWARTELMARGDSIDNLASFLVRIVRGEVEVPPPIDVTMAAPHLKVIPPKALWWLYHQAKELVRHPRTLGSDPDYSDDLHALRGAEERVRRWEQLLFGP